MKKAGTVDDLVIRKKRIPVQRLEVDQTTLKFYLDNPRLYSILREGRGEPTQEEVQDKLAKMEHVRELVQSIKENGGLMDPVIVQGGSNVVLEGNSRLAAYRILASQDPITWAKIKAQILPSGIEESEIFALLGEYHIKGRKDWAPFEQAGYLYRRHKNHDVPIPVLAQQISIGKRQVAHLIAVYEFMAERNEKDVTRWSYYDEYLKSNKIKKARAAYPQLDDAVVKKIRSGEIPRAVDVRDDLKKIVVVGGKVLERFATGKADFGSSVEAAVNKGTTNQGMRQVRKFKEWLAVVDNQQHILRLQGDARKECIYELKKINALADRIVRKLT